jgi:hypothetical protein
MKDRAGSSFNCRYKNAFSREVLFHPLFQGKVTDEILHAAQAGRY